MRVDERGGVRGNASLLEAVPLGVKLFQELVPGLLAH